MANCVKGVTDNICLSYIDKDYIPNAVHKRRKYPERNHKLVSGKIRGILESFQTEFLFKLRKKISTLYIKSIISQYDCVIK